ncbi:GNAT family N-acetyltransferase [Paenibacillus sp. CAU 1782]
MPYELEIKEIVGIDRYIEPFSELLSEVVEGGASIGFLPPLGLAEAEAYWRSVPAPDVVLLGAFADGALAGTVQLHVCMKANGDHRAEVAKLMTHPRFRRGGIGRALMEAAETIAKGMGKRLLVLDTRDGDPSNLLYASLGYIKAGSIPLYARSANGKLHATNLYYKELKPSN